MIEQPKSKAIPTAATQNLTQRLAAAWWSSKRKAAKDAFDAMDESNQEEVLADFEASGVLPPVLRKKWQSDRIKNPMCAAAFSKWLLRDIPEPTEAELLLYGHANGLLATVE